MTTVQDLLDEYAAMAPDMRTKGMYLERLTKAFLTHDGTWSSRFDAVWLWDEWPGRDGKGDTGIDLVARDRYDGGLTAIQCKFFAPDHTVQKADIDSFFTASGKHAFTNRMIVSTSARWSGNAEDALAGQSIPTTRIGVDDFGRSDLDWSRYSFARPEEVEYEPRKQLRPHQRAAVDAVRDGFERSDRGKLIMACGTGKTFTSLRIAEELTSPGGRVLFLVPSIALLSQTLTEWSAERSMPMRSFAICSDTKVGRNDEDFRVSDLAFPATTDTASLLATVEAGGEPEGLTVFFSTYQSIDVVAAAQEQGLGEFDLVICDEAHRTAGVTLKDSKESAFLRIHDEEAVRAKRRLFMTATPKIYAEGAKGKARDAAAVLASMDDESVYGPEFHRLGFGEAVEQGLLSDYRVLVLAVDEESASAAFQDQFAENGELNLPDAARLVGIYNGLAKRGVQGLPGEDVARTPLRRAVAFSRSIKDSVRVQQMLDGYRGATDAEGDAVRGIAAPRRDVLDGAERTYYLRAKHVDGTMNVLQRNRLLDWLKDETEASDNVCRILTNARCLSEGVDVPALDAVIFLNSRDSQVDVVQSVGRVMRRAPGKEYGYIVLPIAVPAGMSAEQALNDNAKYKVVWDVLRALRAHDERFEAKIEALDLNGYKPDPQVQGTFYTDAADQPHDQQTGPDESQQIVLDWSTLGSEWQRAVYAKIVEKVGEREYWESWARNVADIAARQRTRIHTVLNAADFTLRAEFLEFLGGLRDNLNPAIDEDDAIEMLAQHLITQPVFDALFAGSEFSDHNPVSRVIQRMLNALQGSNLGSETAELDAFYASVRRSVSGVTDAAGKQTLIKRLYEKFFTGAFRDTSNRLGIVYTPNEIVDFLLHSADELSRQHFGVGLTNEGVHVLDPFTGTGTFIVRLLESGLIRPEDLVRKYRYELHANEIVLLAYYVAAVNIEATYNAIAPGERYRPFPGIVLTDTFQSSEDDDRMDDHGVFGDNNERVRQQNALDIRIIVGNPPYSSGQDSANDNNQNLKYPSLDARISNTYAALAETQLKRKLYDSYIRSIRWASDRIKDRGIIAFVTNGGFLDDRTAQGVRRALVGEFSELYVLNLRGNALASGERRRREGEGVFGAGSRATVAVSLLVKDPDRVQPGRVRYADIGDYLSREQKLQRVALWGSLSNIHWDELRPNEHGDWLEQRSDLFAAFNALSNDAGGKSVLTTKFNGVASNRDAWVYNSSDADLRANVHGMVDYFNQESDRVKALPKSERAKGVRYDSSRFTWLRADLRRIELGERYEALSDTVTAQYRPFNKLRLARDSRLLGAAGRGFPLFERGNLAIVVSGPSTHFPSFATIMVDHVPDLHTLDSGVAFPRYTFDTAAHPDLFDGGVPKRLDNVDPEALERYRDQYGAETTADDVFFAVYGLLHSPDYRSEYAADLKKMLPRIPDLERPADFRAFVVAGRALSELHLGYESVEPWPLEVHGDVPTNLAVRKMRYAGKPGAWDKSVVHITDSLSVAGIPLEAQEYKLGSRSALDWVLERYQVKTDKASGIVNDPNDWGREHGEPLYIFDLVRRIVRVSMETVVIVNALPSLEISSQYAVATAAGGRGFDVHAQEPEPFAGVR